MKVGNAVPLSPRHARHLPLREAIPSTPGGQVVGSIQYQDCLDVDCTQLGRVHTLGVNVAVTGVGPVYRSHGTGSGGAAGYFHYTAHGTELDRSATISSGTVTLDGASLIGGSLFTDAMLFNIKSGETDMYFCQPKLGC